MRLFIPLLILLFFSTGFTACTQNTDCKGNRICINGECSDPPKIGHGRISVSSDPAGGIIILDGKNTGKITPAILDSVHTGIHDITVYSETLAGNGQVNVTENVEIQTTLQLQTGKGTITINSVPSNAAIAIDGIDKGLTPQTLDDVPAGSHTIKIDAKGFMPFFDTINLLAGATDRITAKLTALSGLRVVTKPINAKIAINGTVMGNTPFKKADVKPGSYKIRLSLVTYRDTSLSVSLLPGLISPFSVQLRHTDEFIKNQKRKKDSALRRVRLFAEAGSLGALGAGLLSDILARQCYNDYATIRSVGDHAAEFAKVQSWISTRDALYGVSAGFAVAWAISFVF
jgi:hypothetical protein